MNNIKETLTRKLGPFPAWVWLVIIGVGIWWYRNHSASATTTADTSSVSPATPESPITLDPGESVYDPNSGQLTTAPGGGGSSDGGSSGSGSDTTGGTAGSAAIPLPDTSSPGFPINITIPGLGKIPTKKKAKPKTASTGAGIKAGATTKHTTSAAKSQARSIATIRNITSRNPPGSKGAAKSVSRTVKGRSSSSVRQRATTPITTTQVRARPTPTAKRTTAPTHPAKSAPKRTITRKKK